MKKDYNRMTTSDMPLDSSFTPQVEVVKEKKTTSKPKINAIGKSTANKTKKARESQQPAKQAKVDKKLRTQLTNSASELDDLEKLNEENLKSYRFKSKRNKVVIILLSVLLVIAIAAISIYLAIARLETNCNMYVHGGYSATAIVDGEELTVFRAPSNLQGNRILRLDIKLRLDEGGEYNIKFIPQCYQKGVLIDNTLIYEHNTDLFYEGGDGYYYSKIAIEGNQTIQLCGGVILDYYYENSLNIDNFRLDFHIYLEKV